MLEDFLSRKELWKLSSHSDPSVRRAVYKFLNNSLIRKPSLLDLKVISNCTLVSSLSISQASSAIDYSRVLARLTKHNPTIWTDYYTGTGKKMATKRLCQYLAKGSQGGLSTFWDEINTLLLHVPAPVLLPLEDIPDQRFVVFEALREGITNRDESRANQQAAWNAYLKLANRFLSFADIHRDRLIDSTVMPLLVHYITPSRETSSWTISASQQSIVLDAARLALSSQQSFVNQWRTLSKAVIEEVQTSLPEQSKDSVKSQDAISAKAHRWYSLQAALRNTGLPPEIDMTMTDATTSEIQSAIALLRARNGKPYGAASLIESAIGSLPDFLSGQDSLKELVAEFVMTDAPNLLLSPSGPYFIGLIPQLKCVVDVDSSYRSSLRAVLQAPGSPAKDKALKRLVASHCLAQIDQDQELVGELASSLQQAMGDGDGQNEIFKTAMANPNVSTRLTQNLLTQMFQNLSVKEHQSASLSGLETVAEHNRDAIKAWDVSTEGSALLARLISLADSSGNDIAQRAKNLSDILQANTPTDKSHGDQAIVKIIRRSLDRIEPDALSVPSLIGLVHKIFQQCDEQSKGALAAELLPDEARWKGALQPILLSSPNPSLAIMNVLGTAVSLIESTVSAKTVPYDKAGHSVAFRLFWFTSVLVQTPGMLEHVTIDRRSCIYRNLALISQIGNDSLSIEAAHSLWRVQDPESEEEIIDIISQTQNSIASWLANNSDDRFVSAVISGLLEDSRGMSVAAYYSSRAYISMTTELTELHANLEYDLGIDELKSVKNTADIFAGVAIISAVQNLTMVTRTFNELLTDLTGGDLKKHPNELTNMIMLNSILGKQDFADVLAGIPKQRLIFFVQHACGHLAKLGPLGPKAPTASLELNFAAESMRALSQILPALRETYGSFWKNCTEVLLGLWSFPTDMPDGIIPLVHASLRLHSTLIKLKFGESNEDLEEALESHKAGIGLGMVNLVRALQGLPDDSHQPRRMINELLARQISTAKDNISPTSAYELFPTLASESLALQGAAYELLHLQLPKQQENVSLDKALSKDYVAKLPEELLSLIIETPTLDTLADASFKRSVPASLRSYLLSWQLVFDHWDGASDAVKNDYVSNVKEGSYINGLLSLASDLLITSRIRPIDASRFDIESYTLNSEDAPEKDAQWLLIHLYYLALKHLPTLAKAWWRDNTSRQTQIPVESWTEKYISPLVIASELSAVSAWAANRDSDPDQPLTVKISTSTREITASIPIDEQSMSLAITLPPSYPLSRATVSGLHRVGVTEQKWRSWIITTQGVINFSDIGGGGQFIDGLVAWRKNVTATLKGQTECAICYSVVSADRQLPSKRCGTCKNLFHGSCLFKWFRSSNSSSCPLCRNQFSYA